MVARPRRGLEPDAPLHSPGSHVGDTSEKRGREKVPRAHSTDNSSDHNPATTRSDALRSLVLDSQSMTADSNYISTQRMNGGSTCRGEVQKVENADEAPASSSKSQDILLSSVSRPPPEQQSPISVFRGSNTLNKASSSNTSIRDGEGTTHFSKQEDRSSPFTGREGKELVWQNVNMRVKGSGDNPDKIVLDQVWGEVPKKQTTAIMGPSGAGKTSLLNILSGRVRSHGKLLVEASVRLDNYQVNPNDITVRKLMAFVAQEDSLLKTETPREAIWFSAKLRLGRSMKDEHLDQLTETILNELGLADCADTIVGGPLMKGISGGERKRTSIGVELVVKPSMVFLDEPTSGLDAYSAVQVCRLLKKVADSGASVLFTIHQPSSKVFGEFHNLILMNKGRVMYHGPTAGVPEFFRQRGHPCPDNYNPSDWMMKIAQRVPVEDLERSGFFPKDDRVLGKPSTSRAGRDVLARSLVEGQLLGDKRQSFLTQLKMLVWRDWKQIKRDRANVAFGRIVIPAAMSLLIGTIFFNVGSSSTSTPANIQSQFGAIVLVINLVMLLPAQFALMSFPAERPIFMREYSTSHYSVTAYFASRLVVELIIGPIQGFTICTICYFMINLKSSYAMFISVNCVMSWASTAIAVLVGAGVSPYFDNAAFFLPLVHNPQLLFCGYLVTPELIPVWLRWYIYFCPMAFATRLIAIDEFHGCSDDAFKNLGCELLLLSIEANPDNRWWYWLIMVCQFVVFRLIGLKLLQLSAGKFYS